MRPGSLDAGTRDPRVEICLADADDALVRHDLDDNRVLSGARGLNVEAGGKQNVSPDVDDLHVTLGYRRRRSRCSNLSFDIQGRIGEAPRERPAVGHDLGTADVGGRSRAQRRPNRLLRC